MVINNVYGSFVFQKINKVRWKPDSVADIFVAGSWDDEVSVHIDHSECCLRNVAYFLSYFRKIRLLYGSTLEQIRRIH